jgi:hypothetical protein
VKIMLCWSQVPFFVDTDGRNAVIAMPPPGVPAAGVLAAAISAALGSPLQLPLQSLLVADAALLPQMAAELAPGGLRQGAGKPHFSDASCSPVAVCSTLSQKAQELIGLEHSSVQGRAVVVSHPYNRSHLRSAWRVHKHICSCASAGGLEVDRLAGAGQPGTPLLAADAACAQLRPLRPFCAGKRESHTQPVL